MKVWPITTSVTVFIFRGSPFSSTVWLASTWTRTTRSASCARSARLCGAIDVASATTGTMRRNPTEAFQRMGA